MSSRWFQARANGRACRPAARAGRAFRSFHVYDKGVPTVFVAAADLNGDGHADIVTSADGGRPVNVIDGRTFAVIKAFAAYPTTFAGSVRVAAGDLSGDGEPEILTATGRGAAPRVEVFSGLTLDQIDSFFADHQTFRDGLFVATQL